MMKLSFPKIAVVVVGTLVGVLLNGNAPLGAMIWPPEAGGHGPTDAQLPFFMLLSLISAIAFGVGIAFLIYAWPVVQATSPASRSHALGLYLGVGWLLVNWVPHENLHIANGLHMQGLLYIETAFHVTLIIAGLVMVRGLAHFVPQVLGAQVGAGAGARSQAR